jgi:hypothetical protein
MMLVLSERHESNWKKRENGCNPGNATLGMPTLGMPTLGMPTLGMPTLGMPWILQGSKRGARGKERWGMAG